VSEGPNGPHNRWLAFLLGHSRAVPYDPIHSYSLIGGSMKFWRISVIIAVALILGWTAQDADALVQAGTYPCATVTINSSGATTAITANKCARSTIWLHSGGDIWLHSGGRLLCHSC
jgi:hypothetical protein